MPEMRLSWQPGFSLSRKPARKSAPRRNRQQGFEFVVEPVRSHHRKNSSSPTTVPYSRPLTNSSKKHSIASNQHGTYSQGEYVKKPAPSTEKLFEAESDDLLIRSGEYFDLRKNDGITGPWLDTCAIKDQTASSGSSGSTADRQLQILDGSNIDFGTSYESPSQVDTVVLGAAAVSTFVKPPYYLSTSVPPTIEYRSLSQRLKPILNRCMLFPHMKVTHSSLTILRQQGILHHPIDVRPAGKPVSIPHKSSS